MRPCLPVLVVAILVSLLCLVACSKPAKSSSLARAPAGQAPTIQAPPIDMKPAPSPTPSPSLSPSPASTPSLGSAGSGAPAAASSRVQPPAPATVYPPGPGIPAGPRYFNITVVPLPRMPIDYALGPLEDRQGADPRAEPVMATFKAFLDGLVAGSIPAASILKTHQPIIETLVGDLALGPAASQKPRVISWRLGAVITEADAAIAPLALYSAVLDDSGNRNLPPRALGEIRARFEDKAWYVEDLSFSATDLGYDRKEPESPFEPPVGSDVSTRGN